MCGLMSRIFSGIQEQGTKALLELRELLSKMSSQSESGETDSCVSGIMDFWSGRHRERVGYGGIIVCGLDDEWKWFQFPVRLENLEDVSHDSRFTYTMFEEAFLSQVSQNYPVFVTTDNENKMKAAFDGRWETEKHNFGGRIGCIEHALSTCLTHVLDAESKESNSELQEQLLSKMNTVENFYNRRDDKAKKLVKAIPQKSTTRPWRFHYHRLSAAVQNYEIYLKEDDKAVCESLPSLALVKSMLDVLTQAKLFFDRVEIEGATSHRSFVNYLLLDVHLFARQVDISENRITKKVCEDLRTQMGEKLWIYCGSGFSQAAAFLSGEEQFSHRSLHNAD